MGSFFLVVTTKVFPLSTKLKLIYPHYFHIPADGKKSGKRRKPTFLLRAYIISSCVLIGKNLNCRLHLTTARLDNAPSSTTVKETETLPHLTSCSLEPLVNTSNCAFGSSGDCLHVFK